MENAISARLVSQQSNSIKELSGFQKHHRTPTKASDSDLRFMQGLAEPDLDEELQEVFSSLRKAYGLKRKEISVDGPQEGGGVITTPFFNYEIQISQDVESPSKVIWNRAITEIAEPARVFAGPFDQVFGKQFSTLEISTEQPLDLEGIVDHIEDLESDSVQIDYDKDLTWCELKILNSTTSVMLNEDSIRDVSHQEIPPQELLEEFLVIQNQFMETLDLSGIPFLAT